MGKKAIIRSILSEYGIAWAMNRQLYNLKLKLLNRIPQLEKRFEITASARKLDLFDVDTASIRKFLHTLPTHEKDKLIKAADDALVGKITAFSSVEYDYGNPIAWNYSPLTQSYAPMDQKWYSIPDFDPERGDIKVIWEISRFTHFYLFSRAYLLTGDRKYYAGFSEQIADWVEKNRYSYGANYKCGQECALRMLNCLINYSVFNNEKLISADDEKNIKEIVESSYKKICSNFFYAYKCIKNNHTISELVGMIAGAWCCEDQKRLQYAYRRMDEVIKEQFFSDGGYKQYSFNYQRLALQDIACLMSLSQKTNIAINDYSRKLVEQSVELLYQCQQSGGDVPNYGSNDGALIFPVTNCDYRDFRSTINCLCILLYGMRRYEHGKYDEEALWFAGGYSRECALQLANKTPQAYPHAGLFTLQKDHMFVMLVANLFSSRPAHFDQLHLDLWVGDKNVFCDSGTYSYADVLGAELACTAGHNTVVVEGREQMNLRKPFFVYSWSRRTEYGVENNRIAATVVSQNGYEHHREIQTECREEEIILTVSDRIRSKQNLPFRVLFHTPYTVRQHDDKDLVIEECGNVLCTLSSELETNTWRTTQTIRSLYYLKKQTVTCIACDGMIENGTGESRIVIKIKKQFRGEETKENG